jgi:hypothetical protein
MVHDRRRNLLLRATAIDDKSAAVKQSDADTRQAPRRGKSHPLEYREHAVQAANAGCHRQCELCA